MSKIETLESRVVYKNKWMTVREDKVLRPSGNEGIYGIVEKPDFAVIIPFDGEALYLVDQYRYPINSRSIEFPQGSWEHHPNADPELLARGELREETGLEAGKMDYLGSQYLATGYSTQKYHIYLATQLIQRSNDLDTEEEGLVTKRIELTHFERMALDGAITDATTMNAYGIAKLSGKL